MGYYPWEVRPSKGNIIRKGLSYSPQKPYTAGVSQVTAHMTAHVTKVAKRKGSREVTCDHVTKGGTHAHDC